MDERTLIHAIRFGYGPRADGRAVPVETQLARLAEPDPAEAALPPPAPADRLNAAATLKEARRGEGEAGAAARRRRRAVVEADLRRLVLLPARSGNGLRERLTAFWSDHFAVSARNLPLELTVPDLADAALRPALGGPFAAMLRAAALHPAMLVYLNQDRSIGPGSALARERPARGLNENLARELIELHTMGVGAPYAQSDVTELARVLAGVRVAEGGVFAFDPGRAEPGRKTVLGAAYAAAPERGLDDVHGVLDDLAARPETARHLSRKLAVHFVAAEPPPGLVEDLTAVWRATDGDLAAVHAALVTHPAAAAPPGARLRRPVEVMAAGLRALEAEPEGPPQTAIGRPLSRMGQPAFRPPGPDGWSEDESAWLTPAALAERLNWSFALAARAGDGRDPRALLDAVLGPFASAALRRAAAGAETRAEGVGLVLSSPDFQRR